MPEDSGQEKTEEATPKRKQDARKRGQVARSAELPGAAALLGGLVILRSSGPNLWAALGGVLRNDFSHLSRADLTKGEVVGVITQMAVVSTLALAPILAALMVTGVATGLLQTGLNVSGDALKPKFDRVNPMGGAKRIFSMTTGFELLKMCVRLVILVMVSYSVLTSVADQVAGISRSGLLIAPSIIGNVLFAVAIRVALAGGLLGIIDYSYQRWKFGRDLKMSKQEVREEMKQLDGNPEVKQRIRRMQRALAKKRMMSAVPKATVIVTNPTHFAVALRYEAGKNGAPIVVAKGQDLVAQEIRRVAQKHNVPVIENPPLARALHAGVPIGGEVPAQLYKAVAEVLAFVYKLKRRW